MHLISCTCFGVFSNKPQCLDRFDLLVSGGGAVTLSGPSPCGQRALGSPLGCWNPSYCGGWMKYRWVIRIKARNACLSANNANNGYKKWTVTAATKIRKRSRCSVYLDILSNTSYKLLFILGVRTPSLGFVTQLCKIFRQIRFTNNKLYNPLR